MSGKLQITTNSSDNEPKVVIALVNAEIQRNWVALLEMWNLRRVKWEKKELKRVLTKRMLISEEN